MKCEDCFKYDKCEIIWKLKEVVEKYRNEKDGIKQQKLTDDFTDITQKCKEKKIAFHRGHMKELKEILKEKDKCFFKRLYMQEKLGYQFFRDRSRTSPIILPTKE